MNTDLCSSVLLTQNPCPAVKDIFTAKTRRARRKAISKTLRSSRLRGGFFWLRLGCSVFIGGCILCDLCRRKSLQLAKDFWRQLHTRNLHTRMRFRICPSARRVSRTNRDVAVLCGSVLPRTCAPGRRRVDQLKHTL